MPRFVVFLFLILALVNPLTAAEDKQSGFRIVDANLYRKVKDPEPEVWIQGADGKAVVGRKTYYQIQHFRGSFFVVGKKHIPRPKKGPTASWGIFDAATQQEVIPCKYNLIRVYGGCVAMTKDGDGKFHVFSWNGDKLETHTYNDINGEFDPAKTADSKDKAGAPKNPVYTLTDDGKRRRIQYLDTCGRPLSAKYYEDGDRFQEGYAPVKTGGKWTLIDASGREVFEPTFPYLSRYFGVVAYNTKAGGHLGGKWGFATAEGKPIGSARYQDIAYSFSPSLKHGRINVKVDGKWYSVAPQDGVDEKGELPLGPARIIPYKAEDANRRGVEEWGYRIEGADPVAPAKWAKAFEFVDGRALVAVATKELDDHKKAVLVYGFIDESGRELVPTRYKAIHALTPELYAIAEGPGGYHSRWRVGLMSKDGQVILPPTYESIDSPSEGLLRVQQNGRRGYMDYTGKMVIEPQFRWAVAFHQGLACVSLDGATWYWIDRNGRALLQGKGYTQVSSFEDGKASVWTKKDQWGRPDGRLTIDRAGNVLETHPLNPPPPPRPLEWAKCQDCRGTGSRYKTVQKEYEVRDVDHLSALAPGGTVIRTRSGTYTQSERTGPCLTCNGIGSTWQ